MTTKSIEYHLKHVLLSRSCLAIVFQKELLPNISGHWKKPNADDDLGGDGFPIFQSFVRQNSMCFWNPCLVRSVASLDYRGCIVPLSIIVGGTDFALEVVRSAWARRVLRPPKGYVIARLGDISVLEMHPVQQTQFAPLSEALCKVVVELNSGNIPATASTVSAKLAESFPKMEVPSDEILYKTLGGLIKERKLYHTGKGYFVVSPDTYRQRSLSPLCERQMLMTNEEAIVRLHGEQRERTLAVQVDESEISALWPDVSSSPTTSSSKPNFLSSTSSSSPVNQQVLPPSPDLRVVERRHSLRVFKVKNKSLAPLKDSFCRSNSLRDTSRRTPNAIENPMGAQRSEKQSMFAKLFRRMQSLTDRSNKHVTFSSQFPSMSWLDGPLTNQQSVATQTQFHLHKSYARTEERKSVCVEPSTQATWYQPNSNREKMAADYSTAMSILRSKAMNDVADSSNLKTNNADKSTSPFLRSNMYRSSPSHRHSYASTSCYAKRHHRHRRSSSESPKIEKIKGKDSGARDSTEGSPIRASPNNINQAQDYQHSNLKTSNPKAIISPCSVVYKNQNLPIQGVTHSTIPQYAVVAMPSSTHTHSPSLDEKKVCFSGKNGLSDKKTDDSKPTTNFISNKKICGEVRPVKPQQLNAPSTDSRNDGFGSSETEDTETKGMSETSSDIKLSLSDSNFEMPMTFNTLPRSSKPVRSMNIPELGKTSKVSDGGTPSLHKKCVPKEVTIDNCVNVEVSLEKVPKSATSDSRSVGPTTVSQTVSEETTVTKLNGNSKVVAVTNITTSLSHGEIKERKSSSLEADGNKSFEKLENKVNNLNFEPTKNTHFFDCTSSCNIVTEVK